MVRNPSAPRPKAVTAEVWEEAKQLAALEMSLEVPGAPVLDQDPVAAMLGMVPDLTREVDGAAVKRARVKSKLQVSEVASQLKERGWQVSAAQVRDWETKPGQVLPPALTLRLATILNLLANVITRPIGQLVPADVADRPRWGRLVQRVAALWCVPLDSAEPRLVAALTTARFRNETTDSYLEAAESLVAQMEGSHET